MEIRAIVFIVSLVVVTSTIIVVYMGSSEAGRQRAGLLYQFTKTGRKYGLRFSSYEVLSHRIIGLDGIRQVLFVFESFGNAFDWYLINLKEVNDCIIKKNYSIIDSYELGKQPLESYLEEVTLQFSFKTERHALVLPFYQKCQNRVKELPDLLQKAKQWEAVLGKLLTKETRLA